MAWLVPIEGYQVIFLGVPDNPGLKPYFFIQHTYRAYKRDNDWVEDDEYFLTDGESEWHECDVLPTEIGMLKYLRNARRKIEIYYKIAGKAYLDDESKNQIKYEIWLWLNENRNDGNNRPGMA